MSVTWAERDRGSLFDNAACGQCGRRVYMVSLALGDPAAIERGIRHDVRCDGCGEAAPHGCMCPELPKVTA